MNYKRIRGSENIFSYKRKASTDFALGEAVGIEEASGLLIPVVSADTDDVTVIGVATEQIDSTHVNYAKADYMGVDKPDETSEFVAIVGAGTATQANVGSRYGFDANGQVDLTDTTDLGVEVTRFINATSVEVRFVV